MQLCSIRSELTKELFTAFFVLRSVLAEKCERQFDLSENVLPCSQAVLSVCHQQQCYRLHRYMNLLASFDSMQLAKG